MPTTTILVVYDPTTDAQPALARAAALVQGSKDSDMKLHVYSCIHTKIPKTEKKAARRAELIAAQREILKSAVSELVAKGLQVTTEVEWDKEWYPAVVRAANRIEATLVFKSSHKRSASQRLLQKHSDRTLLRQANCPVLLVKTSAESTGHTHVVLAAVQFRGEPGAYEELNERILDLSRRLAAAETVKVHFVNAYTELSERPDKGQLVRACEVPSDQVHIRMGETDDVIVEVAQELGADLVVIGNSARDGLAAMINTNTAEKILDRVDCNLLAMP